ncbi:MAG: T9SS type A sorting domain-containing protein [Flavobacteriales bacterium]
MKKFYVLLSSVFTLTLFTQQLSAQCTIQLLASDTLVCAGDSVTLTVIPPTNMHQLTSTLAAGNNHRGNMFDIHALNTVTIESFDAHPMGNTTMEVYYRPTPFSGFENSSNGWILLGSAAVNAQPYGTPTPVPVAVNVTIPAGQTYGFYVTSSNTGISLNYTDGNAQGAVYTSDANIQFLQGVGMEYPFTNGGGVFTPRIWNGVIHYSTPISTSYLWSNGDTTASISTEITATTQFGVDVNVSGCATQTALKTVVVSTPPVQAGADVAVCEGEAVTLAASGAVSYSWTNGVSDSVSFIPQASGQYVVTGTDSIGCTASDSVTVTVNTVDNGISVNGLTLSASASGAIYAWYDCINNTLLSLVSTPTYTATANGSYAVIVTQNGCTDTSACELITTVGIEENNGQDVLTLSPNPTDGTLNIRSEGQVVRQVSILGVNGQVLGSSFPMAAQTSIDLSAYAAGVYFVRIHTENETYIRKVIRR